MTDFFTEYMDFIQLDQQESPAIYHRWTLASIIGSLLGRQFYLKFGPAYIYPNQFIMLMGTPGTRKGAAMNIGRDLLKKLGYTRFAASRTSPERFLIDMRQTDVSMENNLEELVLESPAESYIFAGEFVDFISPKDIGFINLLTNLWDNLDEYRHPKIQGKSVEVYKPTVNLFGGSTPQTFSIAFPPEIIGTGFTARLLLIHSEPTGKQVAWPACLDPMAQEQMVCHLRTISEQITGEANFNAEAKTLAAEIYKNEIHIDDSRFAFYQQRRHTHLLKLGLVIAAANLSTTVKPEHILMANTMLASAEKRMPQALGEFGKSRYAETANEILQWMGKRTRPVNVNEIFKAVSRSVKNLPELQEIIQNLKVAEKIQVMNIQGKTGYVTKFTEMPSWKKVYVETNWLTPEESI